MYDPEPGDTVTNGYDTGEVLKVTDTWVLVDSTELNEPRWVPLAKFEYGDWWVIA